MCESQSIQWDFIGETRVRPQTEQMLLELHPTKKPASIDIKTTCLVFHYTRRQQDLRPDSKSSSLIPTPNWERYQSSLIVISNWIVSDSITGWKMKAMVWLEKEETAEDKPRYRRNQTVSLLG